MAYEGKILWSEGAILIQRKDKFIEWLSQFKDDTWFEFSANPIGDVNASNQRSLYFKWRDILASELGWTETEMHNYLKKQFNGNRSTKGMDTKEWSQMMTQVLAFAGEHNITLPAKLQD